MYYKHIIDQRVLFQLRSFDKYNINYVWGNMGLTPSLQPPPLTTYPQKPKTAKYFDLKTFPTPKTEIIHTSRDNPRTFKSLNPPPSPKYFRNFI